MDIVGLAAVLGTFSVAPVIVWLRGKHRNDAKRLELEERQLVSGGGKNQLLLEGENNLLRERVENLEAIVSSVDFELNQKIARLVDGQQRSAAGLAPAPVTPSAAAASGPLPANPLDRTATALLSQPSPLLSTAFEPGQVLAQRYRIQRLLGRGGMGAVYLADDEVLKDLVALKVISSAYASDEVAMVARFRREAANARKVSSPHVIRIHDLGEARPGLLYLSMEYFAGRSLSDIIAQRGVVPLSDVADFLRQICDGLEAAHQAGVIHRDLKPGNILVGERGAVKIIDFGLATTALAGDALTATGAMLGTPNYMAPEQVRGKPVDARTDVYALGALAYHLVCGRPPFSGDNPIAVGFAHISEVPVPPAQLRKDVSPALDAAILAALAKSPSDRPASAKAFFALATN